MMAMMFARLITTRVGTDDARRPARRKLFPAAVGAMFAAACCLLLSVGTAPAQQIVAFVNGEPITALDVDQQTRIIEAFSQRRPSRKEALDDLVDQKIKVNQGRRLGITLSDAEVDREFAALARRGSRSVAEFTSAFRQAGINPAAFKVKLRADTVWRQVLQKMSPGSFQVRDADVVAALLARGQPPTSKAIQYRMRQIVFVVPRGSPDSARAARVREA
jgi:peptidyl-prolyl cis-trans isomerase SurA